MTSGRMPVLQGRKSSTPCCTPLRFDAICRKLGLVSPALAAKNRPMNEVADKPHTAPLRLVVAKADDLELVRVAMAIVLALVALRLVLAATLPLAADEAYYWLWSKHLSGGYYDHPPAVAFVIRAGTMLFGDSELGVRLFSVLLTLPMTWAVFRTAEILFDGRRVAAWAAIFLNLTLMIGAGTLIVTPDAPLMVASAFVLFFLAKVLESGRGAWWLAVGVAAGLALLSKYTALFFGLSILLWLALVPNLRRWLLTPWPYLGGLAALAVFSPVILWNAQHEWVSLIKQLGRARGDDVTLRYLIEVIPVQIGLATPPIFVLGAAGLIAMAYGRGGSRPGRVLLGTMIWPLFVYFLWHSLHARVEGNWLGPVYPAFAIAAAAAVEEINWRGVMRPVVVISRWLAIPFGAGLLVLAGLQATFGVVPLHRDPMARLLGVGWRDLAGDIEAARTRLGARCVIVTNYGLASWLAFYLPPGIPVVQFNERERWVNMPEPALALFAEKVLYVGDANIDTTETLRAMYARVEPQGQISRRRGEVIETYRLDLAEGLKGDPLDRTPPPELRPYSR
jgi:4-amino-4-deoxy-L-arabinose transferase-like glycosyltransferase